MDLSNTPPLLQSPDARPASAKKDEKVKIIVSTIIIASFFGLVSGGLSGFFFYFQLKGYLDNLKINYPFISENVDGQNSQYVPQTSQEQETIKAVKENSPAVVSIIISKDVPILEQYYTNPFQDFPFSPFQFQVPQYRQNGTKKQEVGGGSGFIVSSDGIVLTNKHVVSDTAAQYTVLTNDGKKYPAKVLGLDPVQDLAIIKIDVLQDEPKTFPYVKLGNSNNLELGQTIIAIGNALGEFKNTISVGVVSGLGRTIMASDSSGSTPSEVLENIIQVDAAINQGNSGGPLINLKGEVVGINTAMVSGAENIAFSIPINRAKRDIEQIKSSGKIIYPFLGVRYLAINEDVKTEKKLTVDYGVLVQKGSSGEVAVLPDSPASKAGIKEGDIILEINSKKITQDNSLGAIISEFNPNDKITVKILRDGNQMSLELILGERKD